MAKPKKDLRGTRMASGIEKSVQGYTDAHSEAQAIQNICVRYNLPGWAPKYLNAYEVKPNPRDKH